MKTITGLALLNTGVIRSGIQNNHRSKKKKNVGTL